MKLEELRINNIVSQYTWAGSTRIPNKYPFRVLSISMTEIQFLPIDSIPACVEVWNKDHPKEFCGIDLTEEWLIKLGFLIDAGQFATLEMDKDCQFDLAKQEKNIWHFEFENYQVPFPDVRLDYVHQLQNIYFALTGEELKVVK